MADIGIFRKGNDPAFFEADNISVLEALYVEAEAVLGITLKAERPEDGETVQKVGALKVQAIAVSEKDLYKVDSPTEPVVKKPDAAAGSRIAQALVFDSTKFDVAQAKAWIVAHPVYKDNGHDVIEGGLRFGQYSPDDFVKGSAQSTVVTDGVIAITGEVAGESVEAETEAGKAAKAMTKFMSTGLRVLPGTAIVHKAEAEEEAEERMVMSMVLEPNDGGDGAPLKPDTQGDIYSAEDIRKAAHNWMENHGKSDLEHSWNELGKAQVGILESYVAPVDFELGEYNVVKGTWMLALRIVNDELWTAVKSGEIGAFSIGGTAMRSPVEPESKNETE